MLIKVDLAVLALIVLAVGGYFIAKKAQRRHRERVARTSGHRALRRFD